MNWKTILAAIITFTALAQNAGAAPPAINGAEVTTEAPTADIDAVPLTPSIDAATLRIDPLPSYSINSCGAGYGNAYGSIDGVTAYYNGDTCIGTGNGYYQCVELTKRYFSAKFGITYAGYGAAYNYWYGIDGRTDLKKYQNHTRDGLPQDGDAIVFQGGSYGHIAMVSGLTGTQVKITQQNWPGSTPYAALSLSVDSSGNIHVGNQSSYYVLGWVRAVKNGVPVPPPGGCSVDGWTSVGRNTLSPWDATAGGSSLYAAHQGGSNQQMYTAWMNTSGSWSGWSELPGQTNNTIAVEFWPMFNKTLYAHRGLDNVIYWATNVLPGPGGFSGWKSTGRSTTHAPDIASLLDIFFVIHKGSSNQKMYWSAYNGTYGTWGNWNETPGETADRPGIAVFNGNPWGIHRGLDNNIYVKRLNNSSGWTSTGRSTTVPPSMAQFNGKLYVIHKGSTNNKIYVGSSTDGVTWPSWSEVSPAETTTMQPGLAPFNGHLYALRVCQDKNMYMKIVPGT